MPDWTPDLSHIVLFTTGQLTPQAVGVTGWKAYVIDTATAQVTLASVVGGSPGTPVEMYEVAALWTASHLNQNLISDDGTKLFFQALDEGLHMRDLAAGETIDIPGVFLDATPDARYVFIKTKDQLVAADQNSGEDLYRYDTTVPGGNPVLVSADAELADGSDGGARSTLGATADGKRLYFVMEDEQLVSGGPTAAGRKLYLWDDGELKFIVNYQGLAADPFDGGAIQPRAINTDINATGDTLVVRATADLTPPQGTGMAPGNIFPSTQIYVYDADRSGATSPDFRCVSCLPGPGLTTFETSLTADEGLGMFRADARDYVTDDGRVVFESKAPLIPTDANGNNWDVYTYKDGVLDLVSSGRHASDSRLFGASANGTIAFDTAEQLSSWDNDGAYDLYVARPGGGLPDPPTPPAPCRDDECQQPPGPTSGGARPGSSSFAGPPNPRASAPRSRARRCSKGKRAVKNRCVKKRHAKKRHAKQTTGRNK